MASRVLALRALRFTSNLPIRSHTRYFNTLSPLRPRHPRATRAASHASPNLLRYLSSKSTADEQIEHITELYATAQDEFEIAMEETSGNTLYAEDDRKAAREELTKVQEAYRAVVEGEDKEVAEEVKRRIGQRIRELEKGVEAMEELAMNQD
ncbi:Hypothetical protein R9X50_00025700 [Acrodontium crateriforme]|uniref:Uncharacterized protein n=1 Tax=Acrodontium crateriforme TaxID=150365 RepID=A0AAQ3M2Y1_9PEZI|nr:Hypothetical protein R9X50_00025700 [Acrodontium crateriforme]